MLGMTDIQTLLANSIFGGDLQLGGLALFIVAFIAVVAFCQKNIMMAFLVSLPLILIFTTMGMLTSEMTILLVLVDVVGLGLAARRMM